MLRVSNREIHTALTLISKVKMERATVRQTWNICANYSDSLVKKFITPPVIFWPKGGHELSRSGVCNFINYQQKRLWTGSMFSFSLRARLTKQDIVLLNHIDFQVKLEIKMIKENEMLNPAFHFKFCIISTLQYLRHTSPWFSSNKLTKYISIKKIHLRQKQIFISIIYHICKSQVKRSKWTGKRQRHVTAGLKSP